MPLIVSAEEKTVRKCVTIPRGLAQAAQEHAKRDDRSFSKLVTLAVRQYLNGAQRDTRA